MIEPRIQSAVWDASVLVRMVDRPSRKERFAITQNLLNLGARRLRSIRVLLLTASSMLSPNRPNPCAEETPFAMNPLSVKLPALVLLDLWQKVAGKSSREVQTLALDMCPRWQVCC